MLHSSTFDTFYLHVDIVHSDRLNELHASVFKLTTWLKVNLWLRWLKLHYNASLTNTLKQGTIPLSSES